MAHRHEHHIHIHIHHHDEDDECGCDECECDCEEHEHDDDDGHDHHHEHEHDGHDHSAHDHHHEHEHGGHDHHHDDDGHDHGHSHDDHDHDHEHENSEISIKHHEESTIAVYKKSLALPYGEAVDLVRKRMRLIAAAVQEKGGFIGHIKTVVIAEKERCMLSITDAGMDPQRRDLGGDSASFELVNIVFGVEDDDLIAIIKDAFKEFFE